MARIEKAKPQPIGRVDVPREPRARPRRAPCRKRPQDRQASALEFVRDLQSVEEELGLPQTPLEVAMDDWALATVVDLDDRTRVGGTARARRRAGRAAPHPAIRIALVGHRGSAPIRARHDGTTGPAAHRPAHDEAPRVGHLGRGRPDRRPRRRRRRRHRAGHAAASPSSPTCRASADGTAVTFTWDDPGLAERRRLHRHRRRRAPAHAAGAALRHERRGRRPGLRDASPSTRDGKTGVPSAERCVDVRRGSDDAPPARWVAHRSGARDRGAR